MGAITYYIGFDWHTIVAKVVDPLVSAADSLPSVLLITFLTTFFGPLGSMVLDRWFTGTAVMAAIIGKATPLR